MIKDIDKGRIMLVSDIHGNKRDFDRVLTRYYALKEKNKVDYLIFMGDMIHSYPNKNRKDESVAIIDKLISMKTNTDDGDVFCVLGNHEFVHIYNIELLKGKLEFSKWFEWKISKNRGLYINFFINMPLAIRTAGGVLIHHAGASNIYANNSFNLEFIKNFKHNHESFRSHLDNINTYDPDIGVEFMHTRLGEWLWSCLTTGNEKEFKNLYPSYIDEFLSFMSSDRLGREMNVLVSGHIAVDYGAEVISKKQLRLCTSEGCLRDLEKKFLLFYAEKKYNSALELIEYCRDL